MTNKEIQEVVQNTQKELEQKEKEKAIAKIKEVVKKTLEALEKCKKDKDEVEKRIKYLRMDLEDLKEGKLDRIEERQTKDPEAKANTVIVIIKEKETIREINNPWYYPYTITVQNPTWSSPYWCSTNQDALCLTNTMGGNSNNFNYDASKAIDYNAASINCSVAKDYSAGTYDVYGKIVNFR